MKFVGSTRIFVRNSRLFYIVILVVPSYLVLEYQVLEYLSTWYRLVGEVINKFMHASTTSTTPCDTHPLL